MKSANLCLAAAAIAAAFWGPDVSAQDEPPAPHLNQGRNPTAPSRMPSETTGDPYQPTFPSRLEEPVVPPAEPAEPDRRTHKGRARGGDLLRGTTVPAAIEEPNPGALEGGPQP